MNINASLVDQRLTGILNENAAWFSDLSAADDSRKKSAAFTILCMSTLLGVSLEEAREMVTDGGNDVGVDGIHVGDVADGEFLVSLFQAKYKKKLDGTSHFPETEVRKAINTVAILFDPAKDVAMNDRIAPRIEEIRALVRDGYIPTVRFVLCNNGLRWNEMAQQWIEAACFPRDQVEWVHCNHDGIIAALQRTKQVDDGLRFAGQALIESFNFRRVLVGKVPVAEIAGLFARHGDRLLERNIRRYLGMTSNRVNRDMFATLDDPSNRENFYFFNNGITIICKQFRHNALQGGNFQVKLENIQIINGGQTCKTIEKVLNATKDSNVFSNVFVMVRILELESDDATLVHDITLATNSQNPVDLRDLKSNDSLQKHLEIGLKGFGFTYKSKSGDGVGGSEVITSAIVAESTLAIWRCKPHQAKFMRREHFGKLYRTIFEDLNAAQALLAVLIFRFVENERKRPTMDVPPAFLPYASHHLAMEVGRMLLKRMKIGYSEVDHKNFDELRSIFEREKRKFHRDAVARTEKTLQGLYGDRQQSLQQLSATFRRGDLKS
ncbi:MAG: AIPR family protein [Magnetococcales bacterium]|nr:AIPR family protein [Magnetococcales bacterium]